MNSLNRLLIPAKDCLCCVKHHPAIESPGELRHVTNNDVRLAALGITCATPMPSTDDELNVKFNELVDELGLNGKHRDAMFSLPPEKKWQIYCSKKMEDRHLSNSLLQNPDDYISTLNTFRITPNPDDIEERTESMESLKTALRSQTMTFLLTFLDLGGLDALLSFVEDIDKTSMGNQRIHTSAIICIQNIMNSTEGRANVLSHPTALRVIAQSLITTNVRTKIAVLELLGATCLVPGGHRKVLQAMTDFQHYRKERTRFQSLMIDLDVSLDDYRWEVALKTTAMSFVNALISCGAGQTHLEFRLHLRYEFLMLGIQTICDKLRQIGNETLNRHLDFFEMVRISDEKDFAKRFSVNHVDSKSASSMFELLRKKLSLSQAYPHFLSLFFHLLQLPTTGVRVVQLWQLVDRIVQQVALQVKDSVDTDVTVLDIDVRKLVSQLTNETAIKESQKKMREVEKTNDELSSRLSKKERECESKNQEKEELMQTLNKVKNKLEKESLNYEEQINHLKSRISQLEQLIIDQSQRDPSLCRVLPNPSVAESAFSFTSPINPSPLEPLNSQDDQSSSFDPPSAPLSGGIPPPPPPPPSGLLASASVRSKNLPQPSQPLKSFNWTKLPDNRLQGTIWTEIDEIKALKKLDLEDFERNFSAYQRQDEAADGGRSPAKARELTIIDGRRAQNCTIMLSKLKMTNEELKLAIMSVDSQEDISKDMCEQLLKFVPTTEEIQMLSEHSRELNQMARADHFLFEMSRIDHYEERLKALFFKKNYSDRLSATIPMVKDVSEASTEVSSSFCLRGILGIVLAFGNFMNRGQRGNASGFRIASLNKIIDTKSSTNKRSTLLHYLAEVIDKNCQDLLHLEDDLSHIKGAAKIKLTDLEAEIGALRLGLKDIEKELQYQQQRRKAAVDSSSSSSSHGRDVDPFVSVMSAFLQVASCRFEDLEDDFRAMKDKFDRCVVLMGEEAKKIQPDEFFGVFDQFLVSLSEARHDNILWQRVREEEEKRAQKEIEMRAERERMKTRSEPNLKGDQNGEMDDLICALKNLDAFRDFAPGGNRKRGRLASYGQGGGPPLSRVTADASPKNRLTSTSANSQDRIFIIS